MMKMALAVGTSAYTSHRALYGYVASFYVCIAFIAKTAVTTQIIVSPQIDSTKVATYLGDSVHAIDGVAIV